MAKNAMEAEQMHQFMSWRESPDSGVDGMGDWGEYESLSAATGTCPWLMASLWPDLHAGPSSERALGVLPAGLVATLVSVEAELTLLFKLPGREKQ